MTRTEPQLTCDFGTTAAGPMVYLVARSHEGVRRLISLFRELSGARVGTVINMAELDDVALTSRISEFDLCVSVDERGHSLVHDGDGSFVWWGSNYEWESIMLLAEPLSHGSGHQHLTSMQPHVDAEVELSVGEGMTGSGRSPIASHARDRLSGQNEQPDTYRAGRGLTDHGVQDSRMTHLATCQHCGTTNVVAECMVCSRPFVLTEALREDRIRRFDEIGLDVAPKDVALVCDFDRAKRSGEPTTTIVEQGLRQKTCVACRTSIL